MKQERGHSHGRSHSQNMYGQYILFLENTAMNGVWIVDRSMEQIHRGHGHEDMSCKDLPPDAGKIIWEVFDGKLSFSESFGTFSGTPIVTVAVPVIQDDYVAGAVLLHSDIEDISSMAAAVVIAFFTANHLAGRFTKPLGKMKTAAQKISDGNYAARTDIAQDDETGELAAALDEMAGRLKAASQESARMEKLRRNFMANVSHRLRTPVTVIRGSLEACATVWSAGPAW